MSFSSQVKSELCTHKYEKPCCGRAFCYGVSCFAKSFGEQEICIHTEKQALAQHFRSAYAQQGIHGTLRACELHGRKKIEYRAKDPQEIGAFLARCDLSAKELLPVREEELFSCPECRHAYLAGAFLCGGVVSDPGREYRVEFITARASRAEELEQVLREAGFEPRRSRKNNSEVVYLKLSEQVEDLLTYIGAVHSTMEIMNEKIYKNYRNVANRITNCETANIDKMIDANQKTIAAIRYLQDEGGFAALSEELKATAICRLANPQATLAELAGMMMPPVSKSGMCHRVKKLEEAAEKLKEHKAYE